MSDNKGFYRRSLLCLFGNSFSIETHGEALKMKSDFYWYVKHINIQRTYLIIMFDGIRNPLVYITSFAKYGLNISRNEK